jgi:HD-like signal output (HDOD) protein/CheY-like chemotaxis protein
MKTSDRADRGKERFMKRILFVDDDPSVLEGLRRMLRPHRHHWDMRFAGGGEEALVMLARDPCDVVVTDMRMSGMDGAQLLARVRDDFPGVVRIVLSGYCEMEATLRAVSVTHQFLQKPADGDRLRQAIDRACALTSVLKDETIRKVVGALGVLPCLPRVATALMRALDDPDVGIGEVGRIVEQDVAISAKVMQLVNSAFFGRLQQVTSIQCAVRFLGVDVLKQLVVTAEIFRAFRPATAAGGFSLAAFQDHAHVAARIATRLPIAAGAVPTATVAALLHDVGKLVLASVLPVQFQRAQQESYARDVPLYTAEEELLGASHAEIGAYLLGLWGLPPTIVAAVVRHHHPVVEEEDDPPFGAPAAVYFANVLAIAYAEGDAAPPVDREYAEVLGVSAEIASWQQFAAPIGEAE